MRPVRPSCASLYEFCRPARWPAAYSLLDGLPFLTAPWLRWQVFAHSECRLFELDMNSLEANGGRFPAILDLLKKGLWAEYSQERTRTR